MPTSKANGSIYSWGKMILNRDIRSEKTVQDVVDGKKVANRERARLRAEAMEKVNAQEGEDEDDIF